MKKRREKKREQKTATPLVAKREKRRRLPKKRLFAALGLALAAFCALLFFAGRHDTERELEELSAVLRFDWGGGSGGMTSDSGGERAFFRVIYDLEGLARGTAPVDSTEYAEGDSAAVLGNATGLQKEGFAFGGWHGRINGVFRFVAAGDTFPMRKDTRLYPHWVAPDAPLYTVTYRPNGATGGTVPVEKHPYYAGTNAGIPGNPGDLTRKGYAFGGWSRVSEEPERIYCEGEAVRVTGDTVLYAHWVDDSPPTEGLTVRYYGNGADRGSVPVDDKIYKAGDAVKVRSDSGGYVSRTGYVWRGWNTKPDGSGDTYRADDWIVITKSISLYARWRKPEELHPGYPMNMTGTRTILDKDFVAANSPKPVERLTTDEIVARAKAERQKYFDALDAEQTPPPVREPWIFKTERDRWIGRLLYVALLGGIIWARHYHYSERGQLAARLRWHKRREKERRKVNQIEGSGGAKDSAKNHAAKSLADATTQTKDSGGGTKKEA